MADPNRRVERVTVRCLPLGYYDDNDIPYKALSHYCINDNKPWLRSSI